MNGIPEWAPLATVKRSGGGTVLLVSCQDCGAVSSEGEPWRTHVDWHRAQERRIAPDLRSLSQRTGW